MTELQSNTFPFFLIETSFLQWICSEGVARSH